MDGNSLLGPTRIGVCESTVMRIIVAIAYRELYHISENFHSHLRVSSIDTLTCFEAQHMALNRFSIMAYPTILRFSSVPVWLKAYTIKSTVINLTLVVSAGTCTCYRGRLTSVTLKIH